jgi:hypothetical protein
MAMHYGLTTKATNFSEEAVSDWRIRLLEAILFFVPRANPDHERLYPQVRTWALELDEDGWPQREVGLDASGRPLFRAPDERNTGFWPDLAYMQFDKAELAPISKEAFDAFWADVRHADLDGAR